MGDFARLNIPNLCHQGSHIGGDFGEYKPLHSSFNAKLQAICESLELNQKQGNKKINGFTLSDLTFSNFNEQPWSEIVTSPYNHLLKCHVNKIVLLGLVPC
ncbi:hypothetical protein ES288_D04G051100v1 [Gossypium darwinii]|uniref:Uncharacterized protein n=2 Tax=Gossypium TaxID=3633 RepID=A0A5D2L9L5_GOSTO|nr:hypothetical protein ES288_D04G051100v1 [Gossypium darwinii]TYH75937.1 hypothetical protein ES332_D04G050900v1 [Gossypium tomentosum]TYH75938.1 hypothetical protein ES332_D04G050900v1 [Gossypium tomentosum]TYH75939.1 hypothetical protein ES332_D04G050900v1 [Gossypium tomentosum]